MHLEDPGVPQRTGQGVENKAAIAFKEFMIPWRNCSPRNCRNRHALVEMVLPVGEVNHSTESVPSNHTGQTGAVDRVVGGRDVLVGDTVRKFEIRPVGTSEK